MKKIKYKGVYKSGSRWKAQMQYNGAQLYLGTFDDPKDAAKAYDDKVRSIPGCKAQTNFDLVRIVLFYLLLYAVSSKGTKQLLVS